MLVSLTCHNDLIPARGPEGGTYHYADVSVIPGVTYFYWLEEIANNGSTEYGPITATVFSAQREIRLMLPVIER